MKIDFEIINTLLSYVGTHKGRTVTEMKNSLGLERDRAIVDHTVDYMINRKLIVKAPHQSFGGKKLATTWIKHPALNAQLLRKVA